MSTYSNILVVAATLPEVELIITSLGAREVEKNKLFEANFENCVVSILITGIGMIQTSYNLTKYLNGNDLVVNLGVCGAFSDQLDLGEVVNVTGDRFSELGAENGDEFLELSQLQIPEELNHSSGHIESVKPVEINSTVKKVSGITVNTVHGKSDSIEEVTKRLNPDVESMEGAAVMFVAKMEKVPCLQIRAVSNYVTNRDKDSWEINLAIKNNSYEIMSILNKFLYD